MRASGRAAACRSTSSTRHRRCARSRLARLAAHRRRRIDFSAGRRDGGVRLVVIRFDNAPAGMRIALRHRSDPAARRSSCARRAGTPRAAAGVAGCDTTTADRHDAISENNIQLSRQASRSSAATRACSPTRSTSSTTRTARSPRGNVAASRRARNQIAADRADFNTQDAASARSTTPAASPPCSRTRADAAARRASSPPPLAGQDTDVYFFGETDREDRSEEIQDHQRRLHAPACSRRRAGTCTPTRSS